MRQAFNTLWQSSALRVVVALTLFALLLFFFYYTRGVWITFLLAFLLAYLVQPLMTFAERRLRARWVGTALFLLGFFLFLGIVSALIAGLVTQVSSFVEDLPGLITTVEEASENLPFLLSQFALPNALINIINNAYQSVGSLLENLSEQFLTWLQNIFISGEVVGGVTVIIGDVVQFFAFLAITIYLVSALPRVQKSFAQAVPLPYRTLSTDLAHKLEHSVGGYFRGQLIIALIIGVLTGAGFALLGLPLALLLGFLAGVFNLVPYLGVVVATVPALLLAAGMGWWQVLGVLVVVTVANQLETHIFSPLILGRTTELHPVTVILAILIGARLFGLLGAIFAVPLAAFLKLVYEDYYFKSRLYREG